ncbi:hypothetical protein KR018_001764 [Drosophila ironensis]|nr:hypothetical protein KR018_001764 [Drosophila ironensis]
MSLSTVKRVIQEQLGIESGYHTIPKCREGLLKFTPTVEELRERSMQDSFTTATVPLSSDPIIRDQFMFANGKVRMGRLIEELDICAMWICHRHIRLPNLPEGVPLPYTFKTRWVDHAKFLGQQFSPDVDLNISGYVSWAGISSMEVTMFVRQKDIILGRAIFVISAHNATNTNRAPVNPLKPGNELEECLYKEAVKRHRKRKKSRLKPEYKKPPTKEEDQVMFEIFRRTMAPEGATGNITLPKNCRWISDWSRSCTLHPFPENRNNANTIFAGYILRRAMETSYVAASLYCGDVAKIKFLSGAAFKSEIPVHSFMTVTAFVVYTYENLINNKIAVSAIDADTHQQILSTALHITYTCKHKVPEILPKSYHEGVWYLRGRRHFQAFLRADRLGEHDNKEFPNPEDLGKANKDEECSKEK